MFQDVKISVLVTLKSRYVNTLFWFIGILAAVAMLSAMFSARQPATIALDMGLSVIRFMLPIFAVLLVQDLFVREFDRKLYLNSLTYARPRHQWLLGRLGAIAIILASLLAVMAIVLAVVVAIVGSGYEQATDVNLDALYAITIIFVYVDLLTILTMAVLLSIVASTPGFVLIGTLGFMFIARSYSPVIEMIRMNQSVVENIANPAAYQGTLSILRFFVPDLGAMDVRQIALYNSLDLLPADWVELFAATLVYMVLLIGISVYALNKRTFT